MEIIINILWNEQVTSQKCQIQNITNSSSISQSEIKAEDLFGYLYAVLCVCVPIMQLNKASNM